MNAKEYLGQLKNIDNLIKALDEELIITESMLTPSGVSLSGVRTHTPGRISDVTAETVMRIEKMGIELRKLKENYVNVKLTATRCINQMTDIRYQTVLYWYYLQNKTLTETAERMYRSYQNICKLHGYALIEFQNIIDKEMPQE